MSSNAIDPEGRIDLRNLGFITIDPKDAKDFDDAVYLEEDKNGGWTIWVSIADVASYIRGDSQIDREAFERGTSFYFPGFVIPMLPFEISNGFCSLRPDEES